MDAKEARVLSDIAKPKLDEKLIKVIFEHVSKAAGRGDRSTIVSIHEVSVKLHSEIVQYLKGKGYSAQVKSEVSSPMDSRGEMMEWHSLVVKW